MSVLQYVVSQLLAMPNGRQAGWREIADATGVPYSTIEKIAYGIHTNPRVKTVEPLYVYFRQRETK